MPDQSGRGLSREEQIQSLAQGADERRKQPAVDDDLAVLAELASGRSRSWDEVREERLSRMTPEERASHERRVAKIVETRQREGVIHDEDATTPARTTSSLPKNDPYATRPEGGE